MRKKYAKLTARARGGTAMKKLSLPEVLEGIEDTRRKRSVWYPLKNAVKHMTGVVAVDGKQARRTKGGKK